MAIVIFGKSKCALCGEVLCDATKSKALPAFIPAGHELSEYSDAVFHSSCFESWEQHEKITALFEEYQLVWESRPKGIRFDEIEKWGKEAFGKIFEKGMLTRA